MIAANIKEIEKAIADISASLQVLVKGLPLLKKLGEAAVTFGSIMEPPHVNKVKTTFTLKLKRGRKKNRKTNPSNFTNKLLALLKEEGGLTTDGIFRRFEQANEVNEDKAHFKRKIRFTLYYLKKNKKATQDAQGGYHFKSG